MEQIKGKLNFSNVVALLALFIALGGSAYAATRLPHNSVGTNQLKKNSITAAKIRNGAITGAKIQLSTLGTVPNAAHAAAADTAASASHAGRADSAGDASTLQGNPPTAFMQGGGRFISAHRELGVGDSNVTMMTLPGIGHLTADCKMGTTYLEGGYEIINESGSMMDQTLQYGGGVDGGTVANGESIGFAGQEYVDAVTVQVSTRTTPSVVATLNLSFLKNGNTGCEMYGQATVSSGS
jgi:hypothetical protein